MLETEENYNPLNDTKLLDNINNAFIKKFKTDKNYYIYDVNTNEIVKVDEVIWNIFSDPDHSNEIENNIKKYGLKQIHESLLEIKTFKEIHNYFSTSRPKIEMLWGEADIKKMHESKLSQIILNVTEDCNLRCKYCIYSGIYKHYRKHSKKYMSWDIMQKALREFLMKSKDCEFPGFSFYGGEPLLNFNIIQKATEFIKQESPKRNIFHITTNFTVINKKILEYLVDNKFLIEISLNGPQSVHDLYRIYPNGKGSWNDVIKNINYLKNIDRNYFDDNVSMNCVLHPPYKNEEVICYFLRSFPKNRIGFQFVETEGTNYFKKKFSDVDLYISLYEQHRKIREKYLDLIVNYSFISKEMDLISSYLGEDVKKIYKRRSVKEGNIFPLGQCLIGLPRLFVDTNGNYYSCEKGGASISIGNVQNGIDSAKIFRLLKFYSQLHQDLCIDCWCVRLCSKCYPNIVKNKCISKDMLLQFCEKTKRKTPLLFNDFLTILEKKKDAFIKFNN